MSRQAWICEVCGTAYDNSSDAQGCEDKHVKVEELSIVYCGDTKPASIFKNPPELVHVRLKRILPGFAEPETLTVAYVPRKVVL